MNVITYHEDGKIDREQYEKDLKKIQTEHFQKVQKIYDYTWKPCLHDGCPNCHGTGIKLDGSVCVHCISCDCPRCKPCS